MLRAPLPLPTLLTGKACTIVGSPATAATWQGIAKADLPADVVLVMGAALIADAAPVAMAGAARPAFTILQSNGNR